MKAALTSPSARVYPRVCGGTDTNADQQQRSKGLSPRVRGNRATVTLEHLADRSIPACAGEPGASEEGDNV